MNPVAQLTVSSVRPRIEERRQKLLSVAHTEQAEYVNALLAEVDAALRRIDEGTYGICETCHEPIEQDRLLSDPLICVCLDHLSDVQRRAHEDDLELATRIQARLLPPSHVRCGPWETYYRYAAAGPVGGDYCETIPVDTGSFYFAVGDVAGKGVAASLLMSHLSAILRSLVSLRLPLAEIMTRANRLFCEGTLDTHYATLVLGRVTADGTVEFANAGHCPPLAVTREGVLRIESGGVPMGMFCSACYAVHTLRLQDGDGLVLYSDGVTEARTRSGEEYGESRLAASIARLRGAGAEDLIREVITDLVTFRNGAPLTDDLTLFAIRRQD